MAAQYGKTWWGEQWLQAFKGIDRNNRLSKGRRFAGNGSVSSIEMNGTQIQANVKGREKNPYHVEICLSAFSPVFKSNIVDVINQNPGILAQLINRQLPKQLLALLNQQRIFLFPSHWSQVNVQCSCADPLELCEHISAVIYFIANEIDKDAFLVFALKGMNLFKVIEKSAGLRVSRGEDIPLYTKHWGLKPENMEQKERCVFKGVDVTQIEFLGDRIFNILMPQPGFHRKDFKKTMSGIYARAAKLALRVDFVEKNKIPTVTLRLPSSTPVLKKRPTKAQKQAQSDRENQAMCSPERDVTRFERLSLTVNEYGDFVSVDCAEPDVSFKTIDTWVTFLRQLRKAAPQENSFFQHAFIWQQLYYLALRLVSHQAYVPVIYQSPAKDINEKQAQGKETFIRFKPALLNASVNAALAPLYASCPPDLVMMAPSLKGKKHRFAKGQIQIEAALALLIGFFTEQALPEPSGKRDQDEILRLFFTGNRICFDAFERRQYPRVMREWLVRLCGDTRRAPGAPSSGLLSLHVFEMFDAQQERFSVQIHAEPGACVAPLKDGLHNEKKRPHLSLNALKDLAILADYLPGIEEGYFHGFSQGENKENKPLMYSLADFTPLLLNTFPALKMLGIPLRLPASLENVVSPSLRLLLTASKYPLKTDNALDLENAVQFQWQVGIGNQSVSLDAFPQWVENASGLLKIADQYVMFDDPKIQSMLRRFVHLPQTLSQGQLLQAGLTGEFEGIKVFLNPNAQAIFDDMLKEKATPLPCGLNARLRPYQVKGFEWLAKNAQMGFGSLLADEKGLGKTLQVITFLLHQKMKGEFEKDKALVVVPASLLDHWKKEITRFAPALKIHLYGAEKQEETFHDLVLISFENLRHEHTYMGKRHWRTLVIDEAQNIKNYTSPQTKIIKKIKADVRIALSCAPIESTLRECWSVFDVIHKHYLGTQTIFQREYADPIEKERDRHCLEKFKKMTAPFILRRFKTDGSVLSQLPSTFECEDVSLEYMPLYQNEPKKRALQTLEEKATECECALKGFNADVFEIKT